MKNVIYNIHFFLFVAIYTMTMLIRDNENNKYIM